MVARSTWRPKAAVEGILLSRQMLQGGTMYPRSKLPTQVERFVDLGCNVGFFSCWLAEAGGALSLMIDANKEVVEEVAWHAHTNHWQEAFAVHGVAEERSPNWRTDFCVYWSNHFSWTKRNPFLRGPWKCTNVPYTDVGGAMASEIRQRALPASEG
jgi:hypothetical protein